MRTRIFQILEPIVTECFNVYGIDVTEIDENTTLYGTGHLDSIALVTLISDIEYALAQSHAFRGSLADDRAMSPGRSPFRTIGTLLDLICSVLDSDHSCKGSSS
ncbi:MAG: hypothetical protein CVV64_13910 [Candidatus Wallbacteria bacterium HGW-Wallbacteria-1]|jgi:acyl carrier protein|uniref:Carrier domain-containing protein n=1 Tax=Candidatus Wallbacteria bacterium HGW-Wallbacteria-1 TaxID=2013854 RepID=A0A2N1PMD1_9BACT|nr:MAG: hypothetical protein CVV64_13910 [Candidatus Wallbacteria bacterium HGW-Wallbacteria-1]